MLEKIIAVMNRINPDIDYMKETALVDNGVIDSLELMELISELEELFDVEIGMDEIIPEHFNSAQAILEMVQRLQEDEL